MAVIASGSYITLHYRLAVLDADGEKEVISTLNSRPATLQVGAGQLAPDLERQLIGLQEGAHASFDLAAGQGFGARNPELVQSLTRDAFRDNIGPHAQYSVGDLLEINAPNGGRLAGVLKVQDDERVVIDFNHPLAGRPVRFSVQVIGVL